MINILSYVGMDMQSEVCLWCLLGLVRTIFDATLFKVNANLKQVWQMKMPDELSKPVQRGLRTMVSGIMLVQCFTVYVYLAAYIVLLYPVFLEERPGLVLPWLLLAAVRWLLCELTSLALGLGTCLLLGPVRAPCVKFVIIKFASILPSFYVWMLVFSYYHTLKVAAAFKLFPAILPYSDNDYGLELAVRRRRTKSLLREDQLRKKLVANFYGERTPSATDETHLRPALKTTSALVLSTDASNEEEPEADAKPPVSGTLTGLSDIGAYVYEDWFGSEIVIPRDTDRILEQLVLMLLRIGAYLKRGGFESVDSQMFNSAMSSLWHPRHNIDCSAINADATETPPHIGSSKGNIASYLREYPQIFMKKPSTSLSQTELTFATLNTVHSQLETNKGATSKSKVNQKSPSTSSYEETPSVGIEKVPSKRRITISDRISTPDDKTVKLTLPPESQTKLTTSGEETNLKSKLKRKRGSQGEHEKFASEIINKIIDNFQESKTSPGDLINISSDSKHSNKKNLINSTETLNDANSKKQTHISILSAGNSKTNAKNETLKEKNVDEYTFGHIEIVEESLKQSKQMNTADVDKETSYLTILDESIKQESATSEFVSAENIDGKISKAGTSSEKPRDNKEFSPKNAKKTELIFEDDKNKEFSLRIISNDENITTTTQQQDSLDVIKTNKDSKIKFVQSVDDNEHMHSEKVNKELPLRLISNDDVNLSNKDSKRICLDCNGECKKNEFVYKESPLRIISNDDTITNSQNVKVSSKDATDDKTPNEKSCKESGCHCRKSKKSKDQT